MTTIIRGREAIQETRTTVLPTTYDVRNAISDSAAYRGTCKGYVAMWYTHNFGWKFVGVFATIEQCVAQYEEIKTMCSLFPGVYNWFNYGDFVIYKNNGHALYNPDCTRWYPCAMVIED